MDILFVYFSFAKLYRFLRLSQRSVPAKASQLFSRHPDTNLDNNKRRPDLRFAADRRPARADAKVLRNKHSSLGNPVYRRRDSACIIVESGSRRQRSSPRSSGTATRPDLARLLRRSERAVRIVTTPANRKVSVRWSSTVTARHLMHICQDGRKAFDRCNSCGPCHIFLFSYADILYKQPPTVSFIAEK